MIKITARHFYLKNIAGAITTGRYQELADNCNVLYDLRDRINKYINNETDEFPKFLNEEISVLWIGVASKTASNKIISLINTLAEVDLIPHDSFLWDMKLDGKYIVHAVLRHLAQQNPSYCYFDNSFYGWKLENENGQTLAHVAAVHGLLPDDFNQWDMKDKYGTTVGMVHSFFLLAGTTLEN